MGNKIYGVHIFINDVNFQLKDREKQVVTRINYNEYFTKLKEAKMYYKARLHSFHSEKGITYGKYDQRGKAELFICEVRSGQIMNHGKTLLIENI